MLLGGNMTPGVFQAFFQYMNLSSDPITEFSYMISSLQSALASVERVYNLLDEPEMDAETQNPAELDHAEGMIAFSHVSFGYNPDEMLMTDVNFRAEPGQKIAIVGSTGAGKTTLVNLLMRFYEVGSGDILLDGISTKNMTRSHLRSFFGMVLQDTWLLKELLQKISPMESPVPPWKKSAPLQKQRGPTSLSVRSQKDMIPC